MNDKPIYILTIQDIQNTAHDLLNRDLTEEEIEKVVHAIEGKMPWYNIISDAISETLESDVPG